MTEIATLSFALCGVAAGLSAYVTVKEYLETRRELKRAEQLSRAFARAQAPKQIKGYRV